MSMVEVAANAPVEPSGLPDNFNKAVLTASVVIPGNVAVYGFVVSNTNVAAQFIQIFDAAQLPANGTVPWYWISVTGSGDREIAYLPPREFTQGFCICNSSTATSKTIGSADCLFDVQYRSLI